MQKESEVSNGQPLLLDWKTNTYCFVAEENIYNITGGFEPKQIDMSGKGITAETAIDQVKIQTYNFGYPIDVPYAFVKTAQ